MPIYTYKCVECANINEIYRHIDERENPVDCECGGNMTLKIVPTQVAPMMPDYKCPVTGERVTSKKQRNEIMAKHNLVEAG